MLIIPFLIFLYITIFYYTWKLGISPMPTSPKVKRALLAALPEQIEGTIYELGSGWGHLALALAKKYPQNQVVAYELSPLPYLFSHILSLSVKNLSIRRENFYKVSFQDKGLFVCYLFPKAMQKLEQKLEGTVISHTFAFPSRQPARIIEVEDAYRTQIYAYKHL